LFIEFPYIRLGNLKIVSAENQKFFWKYSFRRPVCCLFYCAAPGRTHQSLPPWYVSGSVSL